MEISPEEEDKRIAKYLSPDRIQAVLQEEMEDLQVVEEDNPPLPEEEAPVVQKKTKFIAGEEI